MTGTVEPPELVDRRTGPHGEVALRRHGERYEIISNGCFLMDTSDGRSERLLVTGALEAAARPQGARVLIGGLGVGFSLAEAAADSRLGSIVVVECEQAVIDWHTVGEAPLRRFAGGAHDDPRTLVVHQDLADHLREARAAYDVLCLDVDNGPDWTVHDGNDGLYGPEGIAVMAQALDEGGVLALWSAAHSEAFERRLSGPFTGVEVLEVPTLGRGAPDVVYRAVRASDAGSGRSDQTTGEQESGWKSSE